MKKRILQLIGSFHLGGSEKQAVTLTRNLHTDGSFVVFVATLNNDGVLRTELSEFPDIREYRLRSFYDLNFVRKVGHFAAFLRQNSIDLVHTHDFYTNVFGIAAATLAGVEVRVASKRETVGMRSRGQEFIEGFAFRRAKAVVANSDAVRELLLQQGVAATKISTIYNGVETSLFSRTEGASGISVGLPEAKRKITLVANLRHDVKNVPMLLRTAKRVAAKVPDAHFIIAGEGELRAGLTRSAIDLGIGDQVTFAGRCDDVPALLNASYACVLTSNAEGFSNSILEYMAAGKPVVATRVGGAAEAVIHGETGYLVNADDDAQMAEHLIDLLNNEERAAEFGSAGRKRVAKRFSPEEQLRQTIDLYNSLLTK